MLCVRDLTVVFGGVRAVDGVGLDVPDRAVHGLIGPNGAGKSTALNAVTGVVAPTRGSVQLDGRELIGASPVTIMRAGIARTFQQAQLWGGMTVEQNLIVPQLANGRRAARRRAAEVGDLFGLHPVFDVAASALPFGARRLVEVARAITTKPRIVLLDEPGAGLTVGEKGQLVAVLRLLADAGTSVLLVDHDMELVMRACQHVTVLDAGEVIAAAAPEVVRTDERVVASYLGRAVA